MQLSTNTKTMSSLEIAQLVEARHDNVKRTIERCVESGAISLPPLEEVKIDRARREEKISVYRLDRDSSIIVVAQLCPQFTAKLVQRWKFLESEVKRLNEEYDAIMNRWRVYLDRLDRISVPVGYFCVFGELAEVTKALILERVPINTELLMDISVGQTWAHYWAKQGHTDRVPFAHEYPSYFPQSKSNPQMAWAYPEALLGEFRRWLREAYFPDKFQVYLKNKAVSNTGQIKQALTERGLLPAPQPQ